MLSLKGKTTQHWFSSFQIAQSVLKICYDWSVKY